MPRTSRTSFDEQLAALPEADSARRCTKRYSSITTTPDQLKFIDRIVADSRTVALNHTAGLSTPQQVQMVLFSLFSLMDTPDAYKQAMKRLIRNRKAALFREIGIAPETADDPNAVDYYPLLDVEQLRPRGHGAGVREVGAGLGRAVELLFRLAEEAGVVLLPGGASARASVRRVSLANLNESDYVKIGRSIRKLFEECVKRYNEATGNKADAKVTKK